MRTVRDIPTLHGVPVLVRAPLNEPIENGELASDFRIRRTMPTIEFLAKAGAKVIVCSHIGRDPSETLEPIYRAIAKHNSHVSFSPEAIGPKARAAARALYPGDILILENLRRYPGEKANDPAFAKELAHIADVFVQDSFDTCHREHASIVGVPQFLPVYAGLLLDAEVRELTKALAPKHPALAVIGGAKFETKEPVLKKLLTLYDHVAVGGALANDFLVAAGHAVGASLVSGADDATVKKLLKNKRIVVPSDVVVAAPGADVKEAHEVDLDGIGTGEAVLDVGEKTSAAFAKLATRAKTILWNGPLGNYEHGFTAGTKELAQAIAESGARSIVGGGDTVTSIEELGAADKFSFISTGGGAMLEFLTHGTLPGIRTIPK